MGTQRTANVNVAAPILVVDGIEIDKFLGMTGFTFENPSDLLRTFDGTVVGIETNSESNECSMQFMVHNEARDPSASDPSKTGDIVFLENLVKSGRAVSVRVYVPTDKQSGYMVGQVVERAMEFALITGGGTSLGGKSGGGVTFTAKGKIQKDGIKRLGYEVALPSDYVAPL